MPSVFGDYMVLQRDRPVPVYGSAAPGEKVTVAFQCQSLSAKERTELETLLAGSLAENQ